MLVVLSEDSFVDPNTINGRELRATVEAAHVRLPHPADSARFRGVRDGRNALAWLPEFDPPVAASGPDTFRRPNAMRRSTGRQPPRASIW